MSATDSSSQSNLSFSHNDLLILSAPVRGKKRSFFTLKLKFNYKFRFKILIQRSHIRRVTNLSPEKGDNEGKTGTIFVVDEQKKWLKKKGRKR